MRVVIASAGSPDYAELAAVTNPTKERYAKKHGYDFVYREIPKDRGDACKRDLYFELLGHGYDVFVWIDLDAAVMNSGIRIEDICRDHLGYDPHCMKDEGAHFLWSYDFAGPNSGVYITRYSPQGAHWMRRAYATMLENGLGDETAMEMLMLVPPFKEWVRVCPGTVLNCYDYGLYGWDEYGHGDIMNGYKPGRFILHMPGFANEQRVPELRRRIQNDAV